MIKTGVYKIESIRIPHRLYVGSSLNLSQRWKMHLRDLKQGKHHSKKLQRHYNKYGEEDLMFSTLLGCDKDDLLKTEQYFIDTYNPYFNICPIAGSRLGAKDSDATKEKNRIRAIESGLKPPSRTGTKMTEEQIRQRSELSKEMWRRKRLVNPNFGTGRTPWNKGKINVYTRELLTRWSRVHSGKKQSPDTIDKKIKATTGKRRNAEQIQHLKEGWIKRKNKINN